MFHFDEQGEVEFVREDGLSMIRSYHFDNHKSDILEQRSTGDMLRPVFIGELRIEKKNFMLFFQKKNSQKVTVIQKTLQKNFFGSHHDYSNPEKNFLIRKFLGIVGVEYSNPIN